MTLRRDVAMQTASVAWYNFARKNETLRIRRQLWPAAHDLQMNDQRTNRASGKVLSALDDGRSPFALRKNPTLIAVAVFMLSLPAWLVIATQIYAHGIVSWGWPLAIGPVRIFMYCIPGQHNCVTVIPGLTSVLDWIFLPTRFGLVYLLLFVGALFIGVKSTVARTWQRRSLWFLPVGAAAILGLLNVAEKLGL
jgi:hypothetical protein